MSDVNGKLAEGSEIATDAVVLGLLAYALFAVFQRSVVVGTEEIWKVRPLWWDRSVQISEIRRVHVPTTASGLWLYTDPDRKPVLKTGGGLEDSEELEEMVTESIPSDAEITGHREEKH